VRSFTLTTAAEQDLQEIFLFVAADSEPAANHVLDRLIRLDQ
jgi:plasmid stabilization system protein ParE